jgi:cellulose 1,4-beta-cellobiosidase
MYGACCNEMDLWEANSISTAYTPHVCSVNGPARCSGSDCGDGDDRYKAICDKDGCDFNSYRMGDTGFYGKGKTVDTSSKFTVVTQFITNDGTDTGTLSEIRRIYVQNGKVIQNSVSKISGIAETNSITDKFCAEQKTTFKDQDIFGQMGGLKTMGGSLQRGMVLALSIWDDHGANMLWLDSTYPTDSTNPGAIRGTCATTSGKPEDLETNSPNSSVQYSNIKVGAIGSTFVGGSSPPVSSSKPVSSAKPTSTKASSSAKPTSTKPVSSAKPTSAAPTPSSNPGNGGTATKYSQCGGKTWTGPTTCVTGSTCTVLNEFYSQCL